MLRKIFLFMSLFIALSPGLLATGPSFIVAEIRPVSVNDKGEVLCRTRFFKNPSGGHYELDIEYGLCVLTNDTILQFPLHTVSFVDVADNDGWEQNHKVYQEHLAYWDSIFMSDFRPRKMSDIDYHSVEKEYGFKEANVKRYERNDSISVKEFAKRKKADLQKIPQKALYGAEGICAENRFVRVLYDFGNIVIINNRDATGCDGEESSTGASFNYPNLWGDDDIGYDCQTVTGVLFIKKE